MLMSLPSCSAVAYAEDVTLISYGTTAANAINNMQDLLNITDVWASNNRMTIITIKCFAMFISPFIRKKFLHKHQIMLANSQLTTVKLMRILGVQFCFDLSWVSHSDVVRRKMNHTIGVLKRCGHSIY